jgi:6-phosphogluconolactonase
MSSFELEIFDDAEAVADAAAVRFAMATEQTLWDRDLCRIALAGGSTPRATYALLGASPYRERVEWERLEIFFGDERCVPPDHADSNYRMAKEALLERVPIHPSLVHRIAGERPPVEAAAAYAEELAQLGHPPRLDLVLLGMGPDGHTASLFPGTTALAENEALVVPNYVDKLAAWRVTMTVPLLNAARRVLVTAVGAQKAEALRQALEEPPGTVPIQLVRPFDGELVFVVDRAAASKLTPRS